MMSVQQKKLREKEKMWGGELTITLSSRAGIICTVVLGNREWNFCFLCLICTVFGFALLNCLFHDAFFHLLFSPHHTTEEGSCLDMLQHLKVLLVVRGPEEDTDILVNPPQLCRSPFASQALIPSKTFD